MAKWNKYLTGSIYAMSFIKFVHFVLVGQKTWPPWAILVSDWLKYKKIFSSETAWPNGTIFDRKHRCKVIYQDCSFRPGPKKKMAAIGDYFLWSSLDKIIVMRYDSWPLGKFIPIGSRSVSDTGSGP